MKDFLKENNPTILYHGLPALMILIMALAGLDWSSLPDFLDSLLLLNPLLIVLLIIALKKSFNLIWALLKQFVQILSLSTRERLIGHVGPPGTGKTVMAGYKTYILSKRQSRARDLAYFLGQALYDKNARENNIQALKDFDELESSYIFDKLNPANISCLVTTPPIRHKAKDITRYSAEIQIDHIKQEKRLPAYSVILEDEVDLEQGSNTSRGIEPIIQATYKLPRHHGEFVFYLTAQNPAKFGDYIRGNLDHLIACEEQTWFMRPWLLYFYMTIKSGEFLRLSRKTKYTGNAILDAKRKAKMQRRALNFLKLANITNRIGYRKIRYRVMANTELNTETQSKRGSKRHYYIPSRPCWDYSSRAWRDTYKCADDLISLKVYNSIHLAKDYLKYEIYKEQKSNGKKTRTK